MKIQFLVLFLSAVISAFKITDGLLKTSKQELDFFETESLYLNSTQEILEISFKIMTKTKPDQIFIKLSNENGVESSFKPITKKFGNDAYINELSLPFTKLPTLFQASSELAITLIIGSAEDRYLETVGILQNTPYLISKSSYKPIERIQAKPEIHHIFAENPATVNPIIAVSFSSLSFVAFFVLLAVWAYNGALNLGNFKFDLTHIAFIVLIIGYEISFFFYYLGDSIFTTIGRVAILTGPTVWFGSRLLNYLGQLRIAGQR